MKIEQSGKYFNITLPNDKALSMKIVNVTVIEQRFGQRKQITLTGDGATATFEGRSHGDLWRLSLDGAAHGDFVARLTDRTYPRPAPATQPASASLGYAR